jgi:hypothetical protein
VLADDIANMTDRTVRRGAQQNSQADREGSSLREHSILEGNDASQFGIGIVSTRIADR